MSESTPSKTAFSYTYGNRCYKLKFREDMSGVQSAFIMIHFGKFGDEKELFFGTTNNAVKANIHQCPDLSEGDGYYAWQCRLSRMATTCPRCKRRLDMRPRRGT
jgi:hypothetical protein